MQDTAELQARIMAAHVRFTRALEGLDDATLETEPALGSWPARDIATHLSNWIEEMLLAAEATVSAEQFPRPAVADGEAFNVAGVARHLGDSWEEARLRLDGQVSEALAFVSRLEPGQLELPTTLSWGGQGTLARLLQGIVGHHVEHADELEQWRAARGQARPAG